jgi:hypothetical protein
LYSWGGWILGGHLTNIPDQAASVIDEKWSCASWPMAGFLYVWAH